MIRRHLTPALVAFAFLLACCAARPVLGWEASLGCALIAAAASIPLVLPPSDGGRRGWLGLLGLAAAAGMILGSMALVRMSDAVAGSWLPAPEGRVVRLSGELAQDSILSANGQTILHVSLRSAESDVGLAGQASGGVMVVLHGDDRFSLGQRVTIRARPSRLAPPGADAWIVSCDRTDITTLGYGSAAWQLRSGARAWMHRAASRAGYPASALMEALLLGGREDVPATLYDGFKRTGSLHILALSGLHVTVVYGIVFGLLGFLRGRTARFLVATLVLFFYQFLAGFMPSLVRATAMIVVGGVGMLLDRDAEPLNLLSIAGIAVLVADPFQASSVSFQLSFLAMAGIFLVGPLVQRALAGWVPRFVLLPLAMSAGAQLATLPVVILAFGAYYPSGLVAGLLLVPLTTAFLWAGLAWLPLFAVPWPMLHDVCARAFGLLYAATEACARFFAGAPGVVVSPEARPVIAAGAVAVLVAMACLFPRGKGRLSPRARTA